MITTRSLCDSIRNALDFLVEAELLLYANAVAQRSTRVTWHPHRHVPFPHGSDPATVDQYLAWVSAGHYTAALPEGSLLQLTYDVEGGEITGHRLAYVPCPVLDQAQLIQEGEPIVDVVDAYLAAGPASAVVLRSPIRFDFDPAAAKPGHPAVHLTINGSDCRIACHAPMHPYQFIDFVYRHFYPQLWSAAEDWFDAASRRVYDTGWLTDDERSLPHVAWQRAALVELTADVA